ncbi:MAG: PKD domain-containing protein, partial [Bacteroidetes bacterium]|nr:PKD domain-containing protein [Bacteroidota bacterium]
TTGLNRNILETKDYPIVINGLWYFSKSDGTYGMELWRSDGTASGTQRLTDINPGAGSACPYFMTEMSNTLYFIADDGTHGMELWKYPLPSGPATLVKDIVSGSGSSEPIWLTPVDQTLYFSAWTADGGRELWKSNGTEAGTVQVKDILSGSAGSNPNYTKIGDMYYADKDDWRMFTVLDGKIYFPADDGDGYELWESDGTAAGTIKIADVNPNTGEGSSPKGLSILGSRLLFVAYHPNFGNEWWVYNTVNNQSPVASASATPQTGDAPLTVQFSSVGSYDPDGTITGWLWDFGDNATSTSANPQHVYQYPGTYVAELTVFDNYSATATDVVTITVTGTAPYVYVGAQTVTRVTEGGNKIHAEDVVLILDNSDQPVAGAVVTATYEDATTGTVTGTTGSNGTVTLESSWIRNPIGDWCFTVTGVQASGKLYNAGGNLVTTQCEGIPKANLAHPTACTLSQNAPNPFSTSTVIRFSLPEAGSLTLRVYDMLGRLVATVAEGLYRGGAHSVTFDRSGLPSGSYLLQLKSGTTVIQKIMSVR